MYVQWTPRNYSSSRGETLGYRVRYWPEEVNDIDVFQPTVYEVNILTPNMSVMLTGLTPFTKYAIQIFAYTEGGFGAISEISRGGTS